MQILSHSVNETLRIGKKLSRNLKEGDIVCLFGRLGAGKTILVKGIASGLGMKKEKVISPTFVFIRQYKTGKSFLYHFDLYRVKEPKEIFALGYEEYFYNDGITVIEWADRLKYLLPRECLRVELCLKMGTKRLLKFSAIGKHYKKLLENIHGDIRH
jgi:tRNA threonylcarbamoyladenosine biosynthesis protein TsaE